MNSVQKNKTYKIYHIDDQELVSMGLEHIVNLEPEWRWMGSARNLDNLSKTIHNIQPDLIIMDYMLADGNGLQALKEIKKEFPFLKSLLLSNAEEVFLKNACIDNDIMGYVFKSDGSEIIKKAIQTVLDGSIYYSNKDSRWNPPNFKMTDNPENPFHKLSPQEMKVLQLLACGLPSQEISEKLKITIKTLENHRNHINKKTGRVPLAKLVYWAYLWGIVKDPNLAPMNPKLY
jgi:DNA-binding NarL/FixJ family response regulator